jgi:DNA-binding XRE family transcriptional regulator
MTTIKVIRTDNRLRARLMEIADERGLDGYAGAVAWLAETVGASIKHVYNLANGNKRPSVDLKASINAAVGQDVFLPVLSTVGGQPVEQAS